MSAVTTSGRVWEEATSPSALRLVQDFEARWQGAAGAQRPDPTEFIPVASRSGGSGLLLALLRADLALRRASGEIVNPESYRARYPDLADDVLVALIYEDFCLREEAGESPRSVEYSERFPGLASSLREIFEIHNLVRVPSHPSTIFRGALPSTDLDSSSFPTIGGFFVVEELGRGSFARVFLARERQLADRLVALKVSKTGSREPQALARLQHTNIVPVHSYRIDPATDLHLLCMPFFGRVTLAKLLEDPRLQRARAGAALLTALDRLVARISQKPEDLSPDEHRQVARRALADRTLPRAVAWWGAQMADALRHAHDRGVLHRDLKPSNILITADATPMLLDFNLARELEVPAETASKLGGTLAYMAPEHLAALIAGREDGVDHRADLYSLGLILVEMLGIQPLGTATRPETPQRLLARRLAPPVIPTGPRRLPAALVVVLRRCLAPDPLDRYASAGDLALDLQAVADNAPLTFAREPWPPRAARWLRHNVGGLVVTGLIGLLAAGGVSIWTQSRWAEQRQTIEVERRLGDGQRAADSGDFRAAIVQFQLAADRAEGSSVLAASHREALDRRAQAEEASTARDAAETFFARADPLRFAILGFVGDQATASRDLATAFGPLGVLTEANWTTGRLVAALDPDRRRRLVREVDDLLYFWVVAAGHTAILSSVPVADRRAQARNAIAYCDRGLTFTDQPAPWIALRQWWDHLALSDASPVVPTLPTPAGTVEPAACFRWSLLDAIGADPAVALAWLELAALREPSNYWHQFALAFRRAERGDWDIAWARYGTAIALKPEFPWAWKNRALLAENLGDWAEAADDLANALAFCQTPLDVARVQIERGRHAQRLGNFASARASYTAIVAAEPGSLLAHEAQRDRARLEADSSAFSQASALYDALITADPHDWTALQGRANLAVRQGNLTDAGRDLDRSIREAPEQFRAAALLNRGALRLARGHAVDAWADAALGSSLRPSPTATRLLTRIKLALGAHLDDWPLDPTAWDNLPLAGSALRADLGRAADQLTERIRAGDHRGELLWSRAVLLAAAGKTTMARAEANQLIARSPDDVAGHLIRARIERRAGDDSAALSDIAVILARQPEHAAAIELRGLIRVDRGDWADGLTDLTVAYARGAATARGRALAEALSKLGRTSEAIEVCTWLVAADPADADAHLGLAVGYRQIGQWDQCLASLEVAAGMVEPNSAWLGRLVLTYMTCLPARPDRLPRVLTLGRIWLSHNLMSRWTAPVVNP